MIYNAILLHLGLDDTGDEPLAFGRTLARRFEADLIALSACAPQRPSLTGEAAMLRDELLRQQIDDIEKRLAALKEAFEAAAGEDGRVSWRGMVGSPTTLLARHARAADLVVVAQENTDFGTAGDDGVDVGTLILGAGRPVLVAAEGAPAIAAQSVVVGWKDTREARRAVADAMPFLVHAKEVLVAAVDEGAQDDPQAGLADVVRYLMRHGAKARSEVLDGRSLLAGAALTDAARGMGADLLVAGAFGHSRFREWVFGGATRSLLGDGSLHRLFSS
ncbi:universal stress protein [Aquibium sp. A9E412]|uniref:universal stress protein n=1 Tax=Aquibium sp. A9E412 TaxID=2976767 RepID=UPI0025AF495B|nr:universal stress protein [Aquibium sp. A9E412]MDN2568305.1 universal stress protein [Aquibium sp. A9E412]